MGFKEMHVQLIRPQATQLSFRLYERSLHPELFDAYAEASLLTADLQATCRICLGGHSVTLAHGGRVVTEVVGSDEDDFPEFGQCVRHRLRNGRDATAHLRSGAKYHWGAHVEFTDPEVFDYLHSELVSEIPSATLSYQFPAMHRLRPGPISLLILESLPHALSIRSFHTFPDDLAVLRTQSLLKF